MAKAQAKTQQPATPPAPAPEVPASTAEVPVLPPDHPFGGMSAAELAELLQDTETRLKAQEQENRAKDEEIQSLLQNAGHKFNPSAKPMTGEDGGWMFEITPLVDGKPELSHLEPVKARACDEGELKRWYCHSHEMTVGTGVAVDPVKVRFKIVCLEEEKRKLSIVTSQRIGALRQKLAVGAQLSESDQQLLDEHSDRIWGITSS